MTTDLYDEGGWRGGGQGAHPVEAVEDRHARALAGERHGGGHPSDGRHALPWSLVSHQ